MHRDAICHPLYREEDTLFCVENTISPPYGEGVCLNHAIRRAQTDGSRPQVKRISCKLFYVQLEIRQTRRNVEGRTPTKTTPEPHLVPGVVSGVVPLVKT